jgi:hypothetical protein
MVTPTFLYGSGTWTVTAERERKIRTTQRRMLRRILGSGRKPLAPSEKSDSDDDDISEPEEIEGEADMTEESWLDWIRRTTKVAEEQNQVGSRPSGERSGDGRAIWPGDQTADGTGGC